MVGDISKSRNTIWYYFEAWRSRVQFFGISHPLDMTMMCVQWNVSLHRLDCPPVISWVTSNSLDLTWWNGNHIEENNTTSSTVVWQDDVTDLGDITPIGIINEVCGPGFCWELRVLKYINHNAPSKMTWKLKLSWATLAELPVSGSWLFRMDASRSRLAPVAINIGSSLGDIVGLPGRMGRRGSWRAREMFEESCCCISFVWCLSLTV